MLVKCRNYDTFSWQAFFWETELVILMKGHCMVICTCKKHWHEPKANMYDGSHSENLSGTVINKTPLMIRSEWISVCFWQTPRGGTCCSYVLCSTALLQTTTSVCQLLECLADSTNDGTWYLQRSHFALHFLFLTYLATSQWLPIWQLFCARSNLGVCDLAREGNLGYVLVVQEKAGFCAGIGSF